jgi:voltage-gated sodium channel
MQHNLLRETGNPAWRLVHAGWFQPLMVFFILAAGVLTGLETSSSFVARHGHILRLLDTIILAVFMVEIGLRIASHGRQPWAFFRKGWNVFDFVIVAVCCLPLDSQFAAVFRLVRGLRLLRLITVLPKLQLLVGALLKSLGAMGYVSLLLALVFYVYGVAGVHLFGQLDPAHFGSLSASLLSLFRLITLDNWSDLFLAVNQHARLASLVFFISFIMLGTMIMLNLFIGIVMNSMSEMHAEIESAETQRAQSAAGQKTFPQELEALEQELDGLKSRIGQLRARALAEPRPGAAFGGEVCSPQAASPQPAWRISENSQPAG